MILIVNHFPEYQRSTLASFTFKGLHECVVILIVRLILVTDSTASAFEGTNAVELSDHAFSGTQEYASHCHRVDPLAIL